MAVTIIQKGKGEQGVVFSIETFQNGKRWRWTRYRYELGNGDVHLHDDFQEIPDDGRPLLFIPGGSDVDRIAVRDISQEKEQGPRREPRKRPDLTQMYHDFNEARALELKGIRRYAMFPRKKP